MEDIKKIIERLDFKIESYEQTVVTIENDLKRTDD